jgi:hypothetical protein
VLLSAWPSRETVRALPKGGQFDTIPVARTVVGRDGTYELRAALTPLLAGLIGAEGLDLEVQVIHGGRQFDYLTGVQPVREAGAWVRSLTDDSARPAPGANARNQLDIAVRRATAERLPADLLRPTRIRSTDTDPFANEPMFPGRWCTRYTKIDVKKPLETVATAVARDGVTAQAFYSVGATTESSAGLSLDGLGFEVAGSRTHTSTTSTQFPKLESPRKGVAQGQYAAQVAHNLLEQRCMTDMQGRGYRTKFKTAPDQTIGAKPVKVTGQAWKCNRDNRAAASGLMTADTQRAHTYKRGFTFLPLPGAIFTGSATSGYSKSVMLQFDYSKVGGLGFWCGHTGFPSAKNQMIQGYVR